MVNDITDKAVKRLTQVTSAMKQDGDNRVGLIRSETAKAVSREMGRAQAMRPEVVGSALNQIDERDPEVLNAVIEVLETEKLLKTNAEIAMIPSDASILLQVGGSRTGA